VIFEFDNKAAMTLRFEPQKKIITFEHLAPPHKIFINDFTKYMPDGSYDYYKLKKGMWYKNEMLFDNLKIKTD
jgi:hypothetical protein